MNVKEIHVDRLKPDPENPRRHSDRNMKAITASLEEHGLVSPLIVQKSSMMVIGGNARLQALKRLGYSEVSCAIIDVDDKAARKLSISLNRSGELATWNEDTLAKHLNYFSELEDDLTSLGFSDEEFERLAANFEDVDLAEFMPDEDESSEESEDETGSVEVMPEGMQPETMRSSAVKVIQLFIDESQEQQFRLNLRRAAEILGKTNVTDTVTAAIEKILSDHSGS